MQGSAAETARLLSICLSTVPQPSFPHDPPVRHPCVSPTPHRCSTSTPAGVQRRADRRTAARICATRLASSLRSATVSPGPGTGRGGAWVDGGQHARRPRRTASARLFFCQRCRGPRNAIHALACPTLVCGALCAHPAPGGFFCARSTPPTAKHTNGRTITRAPIVADRRAQPASRPDACFRRHERLAQPARCDRPCLAPPLATRRCVPLPSFQGVDQPPAPSA